MHDHHKCNKKKPGFTEEHALRVKSPVKPDGLAREEKRNNLNSSSPETFGNSRVRQDMHTNNVDVNGLNMERVEQDKGDQAMRQWSNTKK